MQKSERRQKLLCVPLDCILDLLIPVSDYSAIRKIKLSDDVRPVTAFWNAERREFGIIIESREFEPVPDYTETPKIEFDEGMIKAVPVCRLEETKICIDNDVTRIWIDTPSAINIEYARQILSRVGYVDRVDVPKNFNIVNKTAED